LHDDCAGAAGILDFVWGDVVDPKLAMLVLLFGAIIVLSHMSADRAARLRDRLASWGLRKSTPITDKV